VVLNARENEPTAVLLLPVVFRFRVLIPNAVFSAPVVFTLSELKPIAKFDVTPPEPYAVTVPVNDGEASGAAPNAVRAADLSDESMKSAMSVETTMFAISN
jgi:hypothetical protein